MKLLTNSRLRCYRECERKHHYSYTLGYRPAVEPEALRFGSLWHLGMECLWRGEGLVAALDAVSPRAFDAFERVRAVEMLCTYVDYWGEPEAGCLVEVEFRCPLLNPETMAPSRTWALAGKIDAIEPLQESEARIVEHKTTSESIDSDEVDYFARLAMDHQISGYVLGAESLGYRVTECLYDVVAKPKLRPLSATPPEARKYTKAGTLYANQRDRDETPEEYGERLRADMAERPAHYFQRRTVPRLDSQIRDYLYDAWQFGRAIREAELAGRAPRNPDACHRYGRCVYWNACANGEDITTSPDFRKLENVHPELSLGDQKEESDDAA